MRYSRGKDRVRADPIAASPDEKPGVDETPSPALECQAVRRQRQHDPRSTSANRRTQPSSTRSSKLFRPDSKAALRALRAFAGRPEYPAPEEPVPASPLRAAGFEKAPSEREPLSSRDNA